jgi:large subunit ribosomal protein L22
MKKAIAKLKNLSISPRKIRLIVNIIRGLDVVKALVILKYENKKGSIYLKKLLISAISNWQQKNKNYKIENSNLYIKEIKVDCSRMLKKIKPAPQGRAHKVRKRYNHVTITLDGLNSNNFKKIKKNGSES